MLPALLAILQLGSAEPPPAAYAAVLLAVTDPGDIVVITDCALCGAGAAALPSGRPFARSHNVWSVFMPRVINQPSQIPAAGTPPKKISEYVGRVATGHTAVSVARMESPQGWREPGQRPEFEEITLVLRGTLRVEHEAGQLDVHAGEAMITTRGEWVRYSTPEAGGAEYLAICLPAFSPASAHRDG